MITYDSKLAITVNEVSDSEYLVKQYSLENYALMFEETIGGNPEQYIKIKDVEQNATGKEFAIAYLDDGKFYIRTFGTTTRTQEEIEEEEFYVNEAIDINDFTMPVNDFPDPFITCTFINDSILFINLFHSHSLTHHHFFYNRNSKELTV